MAALARDARALAELAARRGPELQRAAEGLAAALLRQPRRALIATGVGKSANVAQRCANSLRSLSLRASFTHAAEWGHGDLGQLAAGDVVLVLSHSGRTAECLRACELVRARHGKHVQLAGIFSSMNLLEPGRQRPEAAGRHLADFCSHALVYDMPREADLLGGRCPTTSVVLQEACVNVILAAVVDQAGLTEESFRANHPS